VSSAPSIDCKNDRELLILLNERLGTLTVNFSEFTLSMKENLTEMRLENTRRHESVTDKISSVEIKCQAEIDCVKEMCQKRIDTLEETHNADLKAVNHKLSIATGALLCVSFLITVFTYMNSLGG
jgi:hypothetical protein